MIEAINSMLSSTDCTREVWLVLGNAFPINELEEKFGPDAARPEDEFTQLLYLVKACRSSCGARNTKLYIFAPDKRIVPAAKKNTA